MDDNVLDGVKAFMDDQKTKNMKALAEIVKNQYDAYIEVGFSEEQAFTLIQVIIESIFNNGG